MYIGKEPERKGSPMKLVSHDVERMLQPTGKVVRHAARPVLVTREHKHEFVDGGDLLSPAQEEISA
jgi:hypothetical protein